MQGAQLHTWRGLRTDWAAVVARVGSDITAKQCQMKWRHSFVNRARISEWSAEEVCSSTRWLCCTSAVCPSISLYRQWQVSKLAEMCRARSPWLAIVTALDRPYAQCAHQMLRVMAEDPGWMEMRSHYFAQRLFGEGETLETQLQLMSEVKVGRKSQTVFSAEMVRVT